MLPLPLPLPVESHDKGAGVVGQSSLGDFVSFFTRSGDTLLAIVEIDKALPVAKQSKMTQGQWPFLQVPYLGAVSSTS